MDRKRKAIDEGQSRSNKLQKSVLTDCSGGDYSDHVSDTESVSSYYLSDNSDGCQNQSKTPITPYSPAASIRYPSDRKTHCCPYENCSKAFNRPARLAEHMRSHTNERIFTCEYDGCDKTFLRASHLNHHVKSAHTLVRDYVCDREGCGKTFVTGSRLRRHLAAHEGRDKYRCVEYPPCSETFRKHSTLQKHVTMVHLKQKPFPCPYIDPVTGKQCPQGFDTAGHLRAHQGRIHGGARFTCMECLTSLTEAGQIPEQEPLVRGKYNFPTYALLQTHIRSAHPPICPECSLACSSSRELRRHMEIAHSNVSLEERRVHPCEYPGCGRSFTKKGNLNVHVKTVHEGEKRFICGETDLSTSKDLGAWTGQDACGKRYGSKLALEEHVRTSHLGLKNVKVERREQMGLTAILKSRSTVPSKLALLTGDGYTEESGRHIPCLIEGCQYLFRRDYDLWLHMEAKHALQENDIQILFMRRAMHGGNHCFNLNVDSLHVDIQAPGVESSYQDGVVGDFFLQDTNLFDGQPLPDESGDRIMTNYDDDNCLEAIDPLLEYTIAQQ
ncbi:hypothetical protein LOZ66_005876 [Ophidiomyces ophidiicola]|nr:hypothetical protein LOZ66_005876 [Ophidiomyces ophidiicola]